MNYQDSHDIADYVYQSSSQLTELAGATALTMSYDQSDDLLSKDSDSFNGIPMEAIAAVFSRFKQLI